MENSGPGCSAVSGNSAHTVALEFDLNETPLPSFGEEAAGGNGDGSKADHGCGSCGEAERQVVVCCDCAKHFQVECFRGRLEGREWPSFDNLMECCSWKRLRRTVSAGSGGDLGFVDMNVSPPQEVEDDGAGFWVDSESALTESAPKMQEDTCCNPLTEFTLTSSNTHTNTTHLTNGFPSSTTSHITTQTTHMNLDIPTQNSIETNENVDNLPLLQNGSHANKSMENGNIGPESFPIQFEDFFLISIGKVNPESEFHNTNQIWPIGYKSIWHDKLTGSIFVCNVLEGDDYGPIFRLNRHPCSKQSLPNASTVIQNPKSVPSDDMAIESQHTQTPSDNNNFNNGDVIGEFMVEGRSTSSAWKMGLQTLISACQHAFQDLNVLTFQCNHDKKQNYGSYGVDSLDKFVYLGGDVDRIPDVILTNEQLEDSCMVIKRWLEMDRFGLDVEFVQELIEQLPCVDDCSEYKSLDARCQNVIARTVGSGFFSVLHNSQPLRCKRISPPGITIASNLPLGLIGDVLQVYEFSLRFHKVFGQDAPLSRQNLEKELLNPLINGLKPFETDKVQAVTSCSKIAPDTAVMLPNFHMAMLKVLVEDMLSRVTICDPFTPMVSKSRKGRKRNMEITVFNNKRVEPGIFPINEITWPEIARRYILVLLFLDDNYESPDLTNREFDQLFHCLNGGGGPLCGSLTGMPVIEADAMILTEASKRIFSCMKSKIGEFVIDKDLDLNSSVREPKRSLENKCPEWIKVLEPIRRQPTNVGARIRNRVFKSLEKHPPDWAKEMLLRSISKDVYKGNASGPTKKIVVSVLDKVRDETPLTKKKVKENHVVRTVSDVIIKRCRMVLRTVAVEDGNKSFFGQPFESNDVVTVARQLDFRAIDLRLDAGFYDDSHESFIEDVREVWKNLRIRYRNNPKYIESIETISRKFEEMYKQEILTLVNKTMDYFNNSIMSQEETKKELNMMMIETLTSTLLIAPWEDGICKVCGKDENDHVLLLCDRCDAEYHTYCLDPPLQRVPKASWYCSPCISVITSQTMSTQDDYNHDYAIKKKKSQRDFTKNGLEEIADLADAMESMEYWELDAKQRVFLLKFLCDESLTSTMIQNHMSEDGFNTRNFLGQDMDGRLYWVLGRPERVFMSDPLSETSSWVCYESDTEIETLIEWLKDDDAKERELKENIKKWQRSKIYKSCDLNDESGEVERVRSSVHGINARVEVEKKFGNIYRCECLEIVGPTRHHCLSCHLTFLTNEGHQCEVEGIVGKRPSEVGGSKPEGIIGKASEILQFLKIILLDIEAALPDEAFRPSRKDPDRVRAWRAFLKSAKSIYEMVQAAIILEDMIKTEYLRKEWRYWSSPSSASRISTISGLASQIYALDSALFYEKPPPVEFPESVIPENFEWKEETPKTKKLRNSWKSSSSATVEMLDENPPPGYGPESVIPKNFESKEETPKKSKLKNTLKLSRSTSVALLDENPPPGYGPESMIPVNSESTPKKSKIRNSLKSRSLTMVAMFDEKPPPGFGTESVIPGNSNSKQGTPKKSKFKNSLKSCSSTMMALDEKPPPGYGPESVIPGNCESKEETPKKSKGKNSWKSNSSTMVAMLDETVPPGFGTESVIPGNQESKEESPKKSKLRDNWKSSSSTMVEISSESEPIKNFIPKDKSRKAFDVFDFSD